MAVPGGFSCCVPFCRNRSLKPSCKHLSFHSFPIKSELRVKWLNQVKGTLDVNIKVTKSTKVCSEHFTKDQYRPFINVKKRFLKEGSFPTIFYWTQNNSDSSSVKASEDPVTPVPMIRCEEENIDDPNITSSGDVTMEESVEISRAIDSISFDDESNNLISSHLSCSTYVEDISSRQESLLEPVLNITSTDSFNVSNDTDNNSGILSVENENPGFSIEKYNQTVEDLKQEIASLKNQVKRKENKIEILTQGVEKWKSKARKYKGRLLNVSIIKDNPENCTFYTGLPNFETFGGLVKYVEDNAIGMQYWRGKKTKQQYDLKYKPGSKRKLSLEDELFLVLLRLRVGLPVKELSRIFGLSEATISVTITTWIHLLNFELKGLCPFPTQAKTRETTPPSFHYFPNTRIILDCTEFRVERPSSILAQRATFSSYKNYNTLKCLIGISPAGMITFVSKLYGGGTSDKFIVQDCKVLELMDPGDDVMVDKGFEIQDIMPEGVGLLIPPKFFASKNPQMSVDEVLKTRSIAKVRVHVERAIRRIKTFHIFDGPIPLSMADEAENIINVCSLLTNFFPALIRGTDLSLIEDE